LPVDGDTSEVQAPHTLGRLSTTVTARARNPRLFTRPQYRGDGDLDSILGEGARFIAQAIATHDAVEDFAAFQ
jgi:hypothetical protein